MVRVVYFMYVLQFFNLKTGTLKNNFKCLNLKY